MISIQPLTYSSRRLPMVYAIAAGFVLIVLILRLSLSAAVVGNSAFLLFLAAVMASAWLGGTGPGLFATILSALAGNFFFMVPKMSFGLGSTSERLEFVLFLAEGAVTTMFAGQLHRARNAALNGQAEATMLQAELLRVCDDERRRIGHDLHDGLGQQLTGISLLNRRLEQRLISSGAPDAQEASKISALVKSAMEWTHDLCRSLSPHALESSGLAEALRELASHADNFFGIECIFVQSASLPTLNPETSLHLYRIAQEAVSNAVRHGKARHICIQLEANRGLLTVQVTDNGRGIDPEKPLREGMGLRIMRYRARCIGAAIAVTSHHGGGTVVSCEFNFLTQQHNATERIPASQWTQGTRAADRRPPGGAPRLGHAY